MANDQASKPRVGVPWRSLGEEHEGKREKVEAYLRAVEAAGGKPELISLRTPPGELARLAAGFDAFVLPGSGADVEPSHYGAKRKAECGEADPAREQADWALLDHAFDAGKPVLAICYGVQLLNVYLGGTLVQDIASELGTPIEHRWHGREAGAPEPFHAARFEARSRLAELAGAAEVEVNSSHHQAIREPGKGLRVAAKAPDGVIEAVEWQGKGNWITGVQWHPERMGSDALARALFRELVEAARRTLEKASALRRA
jgi:putative glutamine amidotransferase